MAWRVHLTDNSIYRLDILEGEPNVLCAWVKGDDAAFFDLDTGATLDRRELLPPLGGVADHTTAEWEAWLDELRAPNDAVLPVVRLKQLTVHRTSDGVQRLYDGGHGLAVQIDGNETPLGSADTHLVTVAMDRVMGATAALSEDGTLHIFQQHIPVGTFDVGLQPTRETLPDVVIADNAAAIYASDGARLVRVTSGGEVQKARPMHYFIHNLACTPDGDRCATTDPETGVIRVYQGEDMAFTHQKFAVDLYAAADEVQLMADVPTPRLAVSALALGSAGVIAFAMEGIITVTNLQAMEAMPRPQSLL
ncbi:MAG: hypothetical protein AAF125_22005 [Chloroflexota bacterium]